MQAAGRNNYPYLSFNLLQQVHLAHHLTAMLVLHENHLTVSSECDANVAELVP